MRRIILLSVMAGALVACGGEGPAGADGVNGIDGAPGADGGDGADGADGADGVDGVNGVEGADGVNGVDGVNGADGVDGADGVNGLDGANGADGADGLDGADWPGPAPAGYVAADGIAGGAAFSTWYGTTAGGTGTLADYSVTAPADYARCKACHGWDGLGSAGSYANRTGVSSGVATRPDVSPANLRAAAVSSSYQELFDLVLRPTGRFMNSSDSRHPDFTSYLTDAQVWNLVKFMREEWVDPNDLYDMSISGAAMHYEWDPVAAANVLRRPTVTYANIGTDGDAVNGTALYQATCAVCHGAAGETVLLETGTMSLGEFVRAKPNEAWFKVKFGAPPAMQPGLVTSTQELKDLYKALSDSVAFPDFP